MDKHRPKFYFLYWCFDECDEVLNLVSIGIQMRHNLVTVKAIAYDLHSFYPLFFFYINSFVMGFKTFLMRF